MSGHVKVGPWHEDEDEDDAPAPAPAGAGAPPAPKVKAEPAPAPAPAPKKEEVHPRHVVRRGRWRRRRPHRLRPADGARTRTSRRPGRRPRTSSSAGPGPAPTRTGRTRTCPPRGPRRPDARGASASGDPATCPRRRRELVMARECVMMNVDRGNTSGRLDTDLST